MTTRQTRHAIDTPNSVTVARAATALVERAPVPAAAAPLALVPTDSPYHHPPRPPHGAGPEAWEPEAGQQGVTIGTPTLAEFGATIGLAAARALDVGVRIADIRLLPPLGWSAAGEPIHLGLAIDEDTALHRLEVQIADLHRRARAAESNSEECDSAPDRRRWATRAREHRTKAAQLTDELIRRRRRPAAELPVPAGATVEPVLAALLRIADPEPADDLAEAFAVQQVVRDLCMTVDGLLLRGSFVLAVPTADRLLLLGPIPFELPNRCPNGVAVLLQHADFTARTMAPAFRSRVDRQRLIARLRSAPARLPGSAAETAATAYFAAVSALLLGEPPNERAHDWHDPRWAEHLRRTYRGRGPNRVGGAWLRMDPVRQGLAYAVSDAADRMGRDAVVAVLHHHGVPRGIDRIHQYTADPAAADARRHPSWKGWPPAVLRVRDGHGRDWQARLRSCPACGGPAGLVVRVPELPFACMCPCGGAPGLPSDLRVPPSYKLLVPTRAEVAAYRHALSCAE